MSRSYEIVCACSLPCRLPVDLIYYVHISNEVSGCGGGDCCGYLLVQGNYDVYLSGFIAKRKIGTFLLLLQERVNVEHEGPGARGLGVWTSDVRGAALIAYQL